jgi:hypothetical protein
MKKPLLCPVATLHHWPYLGLSSGKLDSLFSDGHSSSMTASVSAHNATLPAHHAHHQPTVEKEGGVEQGFFYKHQVPKQ